MRMFVFVLFIVALSFAGYQSDGSSYSKRNALIDPYIGAQAILSAEHYEVHEGCSYAASDIASLTNGDSVFVLFVVPANRYPHLVVETSSEGAAEYRIYEACSTSNNGSAHTRYNRNRNISDTSLTTVFTGPTVVTLGTKVRTYFWGSGKSLGGDTRDDVELILKNSTKYLLCIKNKTTSTQTVGWRLSWYEEN